MRLLLLTLQHAGPWKATIMEGHIFFFCTPKTSRVNSVTQVDATSEVTNCQRAARATWVWKGRWAGWGAVTPPRSQHVDQHVSIGARAGDSDRGQTQPSDRPASPRWGGSPKPGGPAGGFGSRSEFGGQSVVQTQLHRGCKVTRGKQQ